MKTIDLLTVKEAAALLEFSRRTFDMMKREDPAFPRPLPWGKSFRFHRDDLLAWKEARVVNLRRENAERLAQLKEGAL